MIFQERKENVAECSVGTGIVPRVGIVPGTEDGPVLSGKGLIWGRIELYWGREDP